MPERFLLQILRGLVTRGVLQSTRGADGGYYLSRGANQITICDIVEAFDNSLDPAVPLLEMFAAGARTRLFSTLQNASQAARQELQKVTVADLVACADPQMKPAVFHSLAAPHGGIDVWQT
jgi:Rrf2 family protein